MKFRIIRMLILFIAFVLSSCQSLSPFKTEGELAREFFEHAKVTILSGDKRAILDLFTGDAERNNNGKGNATYPWINFPKEVHARDFGSLDKTIPFDEKDIGRLRVAYYDRMWDDDRVAARIKGNYGFLCTDSEKKGKVVFIVKKVDGEFKISYMADN